MTKTVAVDQNNDIYLDSNGNLAIATGLTAVMQACQQAAQTLYGEMVLQIDQGIPYFQVVFVGTPNIAQFEAALRSAWLEVNGVTQVASVTIIQTGTNAVEPLNTLGYTAVIDTIYGQGTLPNANTPVSPNVDLTSIGLTSVNYQYIFETGVIVPDTSDLRDDVVQEYKDIFGEDLIVTSNTPQGLLIDAETLSRAAVVANNAQLANQINPNEAGGVFLDATYKLTGGQRNAQKFTKIIGVNLTGVPDTVIPQGSQAQDSVNDYIFQSLTQVTLDGSGLASVDFQCVTAGAIFVAANTLTTIVEGGVLGWETVNNPNASTTPNLGSETGDDEITRNKRRVELALQGISLSEAIISNLNALTGVTSLSYRTNRTNAPVVIDGVTLVANSIYVCVDGGDDTAIATVLDRKTAGLAFNGAVTVNVTDPFSGQIIPVKFDRPTVIQILVKATVKQNEEVQNLETSVRNAIVDYATGKLSQEQGLIVGQSVSCFELAGAVNREYPGIFIQNMETSLTSPVNYSNDEILIGINQKAVIVDTNITVVVIA